MSLPARLAITLLVPVVYVTLARWVPLPGTDASAWMGMGGRLTLGPFALGVMPALSAWMIVELVAAAIPPWARLRHAGPEARRKLERAVAIVMLVLATFQAFGVALYLEGVGMDQGIDWVATPGWEARILITLSLAAGACLVYLAARWVTRAGLVNGFVLFPLLETPVATIVALPRSQPVLKAMDFVWILLALLLAGVATWLATRSREPVTIPSSSVQPLAAALALGAMPAALAPFVPDLKLPGLSSPIGVLVLVLLLAVLFAYLLQRPAYVARVLAIPAPEAARMLWSSLPATLAFLVTLSFAQRVLERRPWGSLSVLTIVVGVVVLLDFVAALRAHGKDGDLVDIWEERRPYLLPRIRAAFELEKIPLHTLHSNQQALFRIFAPYAPAALWVPRADAERARTTVERVLAETETESATDTESESATDTESESATDTESESESGTDTETETVAASSPSRAPTYALIGAAFLGLGLSLIPPVRATRAPGVTAARLEVVRIDDGVQPFESASELPKGLALADEMAPFGPDERKLVRYARLVLDEGESEAAALARIAPWVQALGLAPGKRMAFGPMEEPDDSGRYMVVGLRSYVLTGDPIVTGANIVDASPVKDPADGMSSVRVQLDDAGATRFADATREWVQRRIAIVVNDKVLSAPVVLTEIPGGMVHITMGANEGYPEAEKLAAALRPTD